MPSSRAKSPGALRSIAELADRKLKWSQPKALKMEYELRNGKELVATLRFRSSWGTMAFAESGDGSWTFKRVGFWQNKASIRETESEKDTALFKDKTWASGGTLEFPGGRRFRATTNLWMTNLTFKTESGKQLLHFKYSGVLRRSALVEIFEPARKLPELPLLVLFGWYLAIMLSRDADSSSSVAAMS